MSPFQLMSILKNSKSYVLTIKWSVILKTSIAFLKIEHTLVPVSIYDRDFFLIFYNLRLRQSSAE